MFCPYCGKTLPDDSMFCDACGNSLAAVQDAPQPQQPQFQQPAQQIQYQPQQPKKNRTGLIAAIAGVVVVGVLAVVLIPRLGAGKDDVVTDEPPAKEEREDKPTGSSSRPRDEEKNDDDKPAFEATPVERPQAEPEPEPEPEPVAWLDEQDVRITRQGAFAYKTAINDGETDIGEIHVDSDINIHVEYYDVPEGYKRVVASFVSDVSESIGKGGGFLADGVFDRYTGTVFEFEEGVPASAESPDRTGYARIEYDGKTWDIAMETLMDGDVDDDGRMFLYKNITVICPEDYDGAVFFAGYDDMALNAAYEKLNFTRRLYTFDRLPFMDSGYEYYYFTESNR